VVLLTLVIAIFASYGLSRYKFRFKGVFTSVIISIQAVPPITLLIPYFSLVVAINLYDTRWALILTYLVATLPYSILMLTSYFDTIPMELDEAVKIDGGSSFRALWQVLVPVSGPGLVAVGTFTYMVSWNEYLFALTLTKSQGMRTMPVGVQLLMGEHSYQWNEMMAMSVLGCIPILLLFVLFQRWFVGGLSAGSVKA